MPLQQQRPDRIGHGGEEAQIQHQQPGRGPEGLQVPAEEEGHQGHQRAAQRKLIAAEHHGILPGGKALDEHRGAAVGEGGQDQKALAGQAKAPGAVAAQVHDHHARKADEAAQDLFPGQLLLPQDQGGDQDGKEGAGGRGDGALEARRLGEADIKEGVLDHRLHHGQGQDHAAGAALGPQHPAAQEAAHQNGQHAGQEKADARKEDLAHDLAAAHLKELIAQLDAGGGAAPEQIGRHRPGQDAGGGREKIGFPICAVHESSRPFRSRSRPCSPA